MCVGGGRGGRARVWTVEVATSVGGGRSKCADLFITCAKGGESGGNVCLA